MPLTNVVARAPPFQFTTEPETKPVPFTVSVNEPLPGAALVGTSGWLIRGTGFAALVPVPVRLTVWGLSLALSMMVSVPVRVPVAVGVKVTLMVQFPLGATELPQLFAWAKSPLAATELIFNVAVPVFVSVTV